MSATRRLAAVADVVRYSHLIETNEAGTLRSFANLRPKMALRDFTLRCGI
jgi:hypothetical protein